MSEENVAPEDGQEDAPAPSPVELEAMDHGWRPEEEFKADAKNEGKKWRSAEEFMDRKSLFDRIEAGNQKTKQLEKTLQQLATHNANIEKVALEKAIAVLKAERKQALADNDLVRAEELRDEMDEIRDKKEAVQPIPVATEPAPEFIEFKEKNSWYQRDDRLTRYADAVGKELFEKGYSPAKVLREVEKEVREAFPEKFRNPNRESAPEMVTSSKRADVGSRFQMSAQEEAICKNFVAQGIMTREQYISDLKKTRG
jgi:predicted RNA-binding Zn ribbon-like protein